MTRDVGDAPPYRLTIDLGAIRRNYRLVKETTAPAIAAAVVKANAYGCGMAEAAKALAVEGCDTFFVETLEEALALRKLQPAATIYVVYGLAAGPPPVFLKDELIPVLSKPADLKKWAAEGQGRGAALKINSGMNRLGLSLDDVRALAGDAALLEAPKPCLVMSHLAFGEDPGHAMNRAQLEAFEAARAMLPPCPASLAGSGAALADKAFHFDMVRPGIGLYGGNPYAGAPNPFEEVVHLEGKIMQVRQIDSGQAVGYGATRTVSGPTRVAVVGAGYSAGYGRGFDNAGFGVLDGTRLPVLGRVSMGSVVLDISALPEGADLVNRYVSLIGGDMPLDEAARCAGRSPYELIVTLNLARNRVYVDSEA